jgi:anti-sigma B factor antagonist
MSGHTHAHGRQDGRTHGLVDASIKRSRAGLRAIGLAITAVKGFASGVEGWGMTIEQHGVRMTSRSGEPRGIQVTEETLDPSGLVLTISGELDLATAPVLRDRLAAAIDAGQHRLVIDLSAISFLDSVALATIVHAKQRLPEDGRLALAVDPSSYVMLVFQSGGLQHVLDLVDTRAQAIELVSG